VRRPGLGAPRPAGTISRGASRARARPLRRRSARRLPRRRRRARRVRPSCRRSRRRTTRAPGAQPRVDPGRGGHGVAPAAHRRPAHTSAPAHRRYDPRRDRARLGPGRRSRRPIAAPRPVPEDRGVTAVNIAMLLEMAADGFGDRVAIGPTTDGVTFADLRRGAVAAAARLPATRPTVALLGETSPLVPVALFGAAWAGVSYAPLNYRLPVEARDALLERLAPVEVAQEAWVAALLEPADGEDPFPDEPTTPAVLLFTSGTTAEPKAATLGHDQLLAYIFNTVEFASAADDEA